MKLEDYAEQMELTQDWSSSTQDTPYGPNSEDVYPTFSNRFPDVIVHDHS